MTTITTSSSSSSNASTCSDLLPKSYFNHLNGPLFDTSLNLNDKNQLIISNTSNTNQNNEAKDQYDQYKNEIYRNSHLIISKQHNSSKSNNYNMSMSLAHQIAHLKSNNNNNNASAYLTDINTYEAKPVQLNNNANTNLPFVFALNSNNPNAIPPCLEETNEQQLQLQQQQISSV